MSGRPWVVLLRGTFLDMFWDCGHTKKQYIL